MNQEVVELLNSFETDSKSPRRKYSEFLGYIYTTFDKNISLCKSDKIMNKYKKMRNSILNYIIANEKSIINILSK